MNRREFIARTGQLLTASLLVRPVQSLAEGQPGMPPAAALAQPPPPSVFLPLRRGTGAFAGHGGAMGWLVNKDAIVVVDTQFPDSALTFLDGLPGREGRKVDVVFNTHHHGDHTAGNPVFKTASRTIVAQEKVPKLQFEAALRAEETPLVESWATVDRQVFADSTFPEVWRRELGDEIVTAQYFGPAHTGSDSVISFERANVVHVGDLVFNRIYPVVDRLAGGNLRAWISVLEQTAQSYPADATYIFGHGSVKFGVTGGRSDLLLQRDFLSALLDYVGKGIAAGKGREDIIGLENLPDFPDFHAALPNHLSQTLAATYDELTAAKA